MEKAKGKRKMGNEEEGVQKQPRLGSVQAMSSPEVTVSPPMRQDISFGRYVYKIGENLTERYQIKSKLGEGSSGEVLECWDREKRESVAIKVSRSTRDPNVANYESYVLQNLAERPGSGHRIVQMRDSFVYRKHKCIVFEKLGPSLRNFLEMTNCSPVPLDLVWQFGRRLLEAVAFLHDMNVIHADLTPENILLASPDYAELLPRERSSSVVVRRRYAPQSSAIKVIDIGSSYSLRLCQNYNNHCTGVVSKRCYRAPEIVLGINWSYPGDLWSVGCILVELCTVHQELDLGHLASMERVLGCLPKDMLQRAGQHRSGWKVLIPEENSGTGWRLNWPDGASSKDSISRVNNHYFLLKTLSHHVQSSELISLLCGLLKYDLLERLTARQALDHPFFTKNIR